MFVRENKSEVINIRVTKKQKEVINDLARNNNQNVTEFVLFLIEEYYKNTCK